MTIKINDFTVETKCKGKVYGTYKITNNSNHLVFYKGEFVGEVKTKKDARAFINNLVKYQKLEYTQEYK